MKILTTEMVVLRAQAVDKADSITQAGNSLVKTGCVAPSYVAGMLARERVMSTYLGYGIAISHGCARSLNVQEGVVQCKSKKVEVESLSNP